MPPMSPCDAQRQGPPDPTQTCMQGPLPIRLSKYILKCYFKLSVVTGTCLLDSTPTALDPITESDNCLFTNRCASDQYTDTYRIANRVQTSASSEVQDGSHNRCQHYLLLLLILKSCCVSSLRVLRRIAPAVTSPQTFCITPRRRKHQILTNTCITVQPRANMGCWVWPSMLAPTHQWSNKISPTPNPKGQAGPLTYLSHLDFCRPPPTHPPASVPEPGGC